MSGENTGSIEIGTLLSARTKQGIVEIVINGECVQLEIAKAREVGTMLLQAIEAATSDEVTYRFMREKLGASDEQACAALIDYRELRQGTRDTLFAKAVN